MEKCSITWTWTHSSREMNEVLHGLCYLVKNNPPQSPFHGIHKNLWKFTIDDLSLLCLIYQILYLSNRIGIFYKLPIIIEYRKIGIYSQILGDDWVSGKRKQILISLVKKHFMQVTIIWLFVSKPIIKLILIYRQILFMQPLRKIFLWATWRKAHF